MSFLQLSITLLLAVCFYGCNFNNVRHNEIKEYVGVNIANVGVLEFESCDSIALTPELFQDSLFLLYRIPPEACSSCYNQELSALRDIFGINNMPIIITSFKNCRSFLAFGSNYNLIGQKLINTTSLIEKLDEKADPYYLLLDSSMVVRDVFITDKNNHLNALNFLSSHKSPGITEISFNAYSLQLKKIKQGVPKTVTFDFFNSGNEALNIYHIEPSCGCTDIKWPKEPVLPNEKGAVIVTYDAESPGHFHKTLTIYCNTLKGKEILSIEGFVD